MQFFGSFFICFLLMVNFIDLFNKKKQPIGFNYDNAWMLNVSSPDMEIKDLLKIYADIKNSVESFEIINSTTLVEDNIPFMLRSWTKDIKYNDKVSEKASVFFVDDDYAGVLGLNIIQGRWFRRSDDASKDRQVVINQKLKKELFANENPIGKKFNNEGNGDCVVVGVIDDFRYQGKYSSSKPSCFLRTLKGRENMAHNNNESYGNTNMQPLSGITFLVKANKKIQFNEQAKMINYMELNHPGLSFLLKSLDEMRVTFNTITFIPTIVFSVICIFLIINLFVGLFGVLWYNINLRKHEIGVRVSMGAFATKIYIQFIGEMLVLATMGILPGIILAVQFPILNVFNTDSIIYIKAIIASILILYALVILCSIFPSVQAARIKPAVALHEE